jgi:hypothetical protein
MTSLQRARPTPRPSRHSSARRLPKAGSATPTTFAISSPTSLTNRLACSVTTPPPIRRKPRSQPLGSCVAVGLHANAVARGIQVFKLEVELEGDLNITAVWGTGDTSEKPVGFTDVRIKVDMEGDCPKEEIDALVQHVIQWSPVFNTFSRPVNMVAETM